MSEFLQAKKEFYRDVVTSGIRNVRDVPNMYPMGYQVSNERLDRWLKKFFTIEGWEFPKGEFRVVNHFLMGADPEFVFVRPAKNNDRDREALAALQNAEARVGRPRMVTNPEDVVAMPEPTPTPRQTTAPEIRVNAADLQLKTGRAYGADNNGRLVEIRPKADRVALRVLASVMSAIRWLALTVPQTRELEWRASPFQFTDGLGGHVHFGRKSPTVDHPVRPSQQMEVRALDNLSEMFIHLGLYPKSEIMARRRGGAHGQRYGQLSDIRPQSYGYEYRTFPTWLDSPWLAYFTLVLSKLAVHDPGLVAQLPLDRKAEQRLVNLLALYKGLDDDARVAYTCLQRLGLPKHIGGDFKGRWGAGYGKDAKTDVEVVPLAIDPSPDETRELFEHFTGGVDLRTHVPPPTWGPTKPPRGYYMVLDTVNTTRVRGLGEMLWDFCGSKEFNDKFGPLSIHPGEGGYLFDLSRELADVMPGGWKARLKELAPKDALFRVQGRGMGHPYLAIGAPWREPRNIGLVRRILAAGIFPMWKVSEIKDSTYADWARAKKSEAKFRGKTLAEK